MAAAFELDGFLPYQLAVAASRTSRAFSAVYRERFGIGVAEWRVVAHLGRGDPVSVREIHDRVDMDKSRVSRAAARLQSAGYVLKTQNPADRRLVELRLTDKGRAMLDEIAPLAAAFERDLLKRIGAPVGPFRDGLTALMALEEKD